MFSRLRDVSLTSSVFVRTSIATLPRSESNAAFELDAAAPPPAAPDALPPVALPPRISVASSDAFA